MPCRVEIGSRADAQLAELDPAIGASVERKIIWLPKTPPSWCIGGSWECPMTWLASANSASATGGFSIGFITGKKSSAFTESSIAPKFIAICD
jgi:hypothetical protein